MSVRVAFGETVGLMSASTDSTDSDGNDVTTWADPVPYKRVPAWPRDGNQRVGNELVDNRDMVTDGLQVLLPPGTVVTPIDRMVARGITWEVVGEPLEFASPITGFKAGVVVSLVRFTG